MYWSCRGGPRPPHSRRDSFSGCFLVIEGGFTTSVFRKEEAFPSEVSTICAREQIMKNDTPGQSPLLEESQLVLGPSRDRCGVLALPWDFVGRGAGRRAGP